MLRKLPIGLQTFRKIIEEGYLYIDKTEYLHRLITSGQNYFLSRPRRFGKSLLLSTLNEIFQGNKELFKGLWIYNSDYHWKKFPVVHISLGKQKAKTAEELQQFLNAEIDFIAKEHSVSVIPDRPYYMRFRELLQNIRVNGKVVILIDEYDKPIIDHITNVPVANEMREILKGFYTVIKDMDEYLRFVLLTGVSKFSKTGVFSGLNQLNDLTMISDYSVMLGITQGELRDNFQPYIKAVCTKENISEAELLEKIRLWYNGYCFSGTCTNVYNPFSTLLFFEHKEFKNYWFETGTPTFLVNLVKKSNYPLSEIPLQLEEIAFSIYEVENLAINPLLFQTGYLTIKGYDRERMLFTLDYPNFEVKNSFLTYLLRSYSEKEVSNASLYKMIDALRANDFDTFFNTLKIFFSGIPYDIQIERESYYQSLFYLIFTLIGLKTEAEVKTNIGRIDAVINDQAVFVFEFKFNGTKENALQQIKEKKYHEKYLSVGKPVYLVGVEFSERNVKDWAVEKVK